MIACNKKAPYLESPSNSATLHQFQSLLAYCDFTFVTGGGSPTSWSTCGEQIKLIRSALIKHTVLVFWRPC